MLIKERKSSIPIIGLTGNALEQDVAYFKECGVTDVLIKPLDMNKLKVLIHSINTKMMRR
jgi:DNA-binding response OmpR family regulator